ncbi:hypothetical protein WDW86_08370 [Bdellovibrionota bacterium FG-2]
MKLIRYSATFANLLGVAFFFVLSATVKAEDSNPSPTVVTPLPPSFKALFKAGVAKLRTIGGDHN